MRVFLRKECGTRQEVYPRRLPDRNDDFGDVGAFLAESEAAGKRPRSHFRRQSRQLAIDDERLTMYAERLTRLTIDIWAIDDIDQYRTSGFWPSKTDI